MIPASGATVRLTAPAAGMAAGSEGTFAGWFFGGGEPQAIVAFWDGGPLRVPVALLEPVEETEDGSAALSSPCSPDRGAP